MPFIFKINVSWKKGDLKSTNILNIFNIFCIFYQNLFLLGFLNAILTENVGNNLKKILVHVWEIRPLKTTFATLDEQCLATRGVSKHHIGLDGVCHVVQWLIQFLPGSDNSVARGVGRVTQIESRWCMSLCFQCVMDFVVTVLPETWTTWRKGSFAFFAMLGLCNSF